MAGPAEGVPDKVIRPLSQRGQLSSSKINTPDSNGSIFDLQSLFQIIAAALKWSSARGRFGVDRGRSTPDLGPIGPGSDLTRIGSDPALRESAEVHGLIGICADAWGNFLNFCGDKINSFKR